MQPLLQFPLAMMNKFGYFGTDKPGGLSTLRTTLFKIVCVAILAFIEVVLLAQYLYIGKKNITEFVNNTEAVVVIFQNLSKLIYCSYYKPQFDELIKLSEKFWKAKDCASLSKKRINRLLKSVIYFQKFFTYSSSLVGVIFCVSTLITGKKLPLGSWSSSTDYEYLHKCVLILEMTVLFPISCLFNTVFDGLYLAFCYEVMVQFQILCDRIERTNFQPFDYEKMKILVEHHIFLLKYAKLFRKCYSLMLMIEFITIVPLICSEVYAVTESSGTTNKFRYIIGVFALADQLAMYCLPLDYLKEEMNNVSEAVYKAKWYSTKNRKATTALQMMNYAAQKQFRIFACGLVEFNAKTLIAVYQGTMSIITVLQNMGTKNI